MTKHWGPLATASFQKTIAGIEAGELYVHCPDCDGEGQVLAYRSLDWPHRDTWFSCPLCHGSRVADRDLARRFLHDFSEAEEPDALMEGEPT